MDYKYLIGQADFAPYKTLSANIDFINKLQPFVKEAQDLDLKESMGYAIFFDMMKNYGLENLVIKYNTLTVGVFAASEVVTSDNGATGIMLTDANPVLTLKTITELNKGDWGKAVSITGGTSGAKANITSVTYGPYYNLINGMVYTDPLKFYVEFPGLKVAIIYWAFARYNARGNDESTMTGFVQKNNPYSTRISSTEIANKITQAKSGAIAYFKQAEKFLYDMYMVDPTLYPVYVNSLFLKRKKGGGLRVSSISRFRRENTYLSRLNSGCSCGLGYPCQNWLDNGYC